MAEVTGRQVLLKDENGEVIIPYVEKPDLTDYAKTSDLMNIMNNIYPVGSVYLSTTSTCPLASLISGSTWEQMGTSLITSVNTSVSIKGTGKSLGLTDGTNNMGIQANGGYGVKNNKNLFNVNVGTKTGSAGPDNSYALGVTTDSSKSGIVGTVTRTSISVYIFKRTA